MKKAYLHNIKAGLAAGYRICIIDGEEGGALAKTYSYKESRLAVESRSATYIIWQAETTEEERTEGAKPFKPVAWFEVCLDWGLGDVDPAKTISDYSDNTAIANKWWNNYTKRHAVQKAG